MEYLRRYISCSKIQCEVKNEGNDQGRFFDTVSCLLEYYLTSYLPSYLIPSYISYKVFFTSYAYVMHMSYLTITNKKHIMDNPYIYMI